MQGKSKGNKKVHKDWGLLKSFLSLVLAVRPTLVTMENVPPLNKQDILRFFSGLTVGFFVMPMSAEEKSRQFN